jgi:hypothetical protein
MPAVGRALLSTDLVLSTPAASRGGRAPAALAPSRTWTIIQVSLHRRAVAASTGYNRVRWGAEIEQVAGDQE